MTNQEQYDMLWENAKKAESNKCTLTYKENVKAVLETVFAGYKEELINTACKNICTLYINSPNYKQYILDCAEDISHYCKTFDCCADCQFMKSGMGCILNNITPEGWSVNL